MLRLLLQSEDGCLTVDKNYLGGCLRTSPLPVMVLVRSFQFSTPYHYQRVCLVLARHDGTAKEWGALGARALTPSDISYKPQINSRIVQGERTGDGS